MVYISASDIVAAAPSPATRIDGVFGPRQFVQLLPKQLPNELLHELSECVPMLCFMRLPHLLLVPGASGVYLQQHWRRIKQKQPVIKMMDHRQVKKRAIEAALEQEQAALEIKRAKIDQTVDEAVWLVQQAEMANEASRYDDMTQAMKKVAEIGAELSKEERNLLSVAYKKVAEARRSSWRVISSIEQKTEGAEKKQQMAKEYREKVEGELRDICHDVLDLLDKFLIPKAGNPESKVFYMKMKGDYYRYLAEVATGNGRNSVVEKSQQSYQEAFKIAKESMQPAHPVCLELALNFSLFYYEILNSSDKACELAKQTYKDANTVVDSLCGSEYNDSLARIHSLKSKLKEWQPDLELSDHGSDEEPQSQGNAGEGDVMG